MSDQPQIPASVLTLTSETKRTPCTSAASDGFASDHLRPGVFDGYGDDFMPVPAAILRKPSEWYFSSNIAFFVIILPSISDCIGSQ